LLENNKSTGAFPQNMDYVSRMTVSVVDHRALSEVYPYKIFPVIEPIDLFAKLSPTLDKAEHDAQLSARLLMTRFPGACFERLSKTAWGAGAQGLELVIVADTFLLGEEVLSYAAAYRVEEGYPRKRL
jgi:hypothetical protein